MKNCRVSLDLIWLDADFRVVEIAAEQPPCPEEGPCPSIVPMKPGRYVLEIAGGTAAREGLRPGDRVPDEDDFVRTPHGLAGARIFLEDGTYYVTDDHGRLTVEWAGDGWAVWGGAFTASRDVRWRLAAR